MQRKIAIQEKEWKRIWANFEMNLAVCELVIALASLVIVAETRSIKTCCPKLDPDVFRNVVSIYFTSLLCYLHEPCFRKFFTAFHFRFLYKRLALPVVYSWVAMYWASSGYWGSVFIVCCKSGLWICANCWFHPVHCNNQYSWTDAFGNLQRKRF